VEVDLDEDEVEEGEILSCPECDAELEVVQIHPVRVNVISDEEDEAEEAVEDEAKEVEDVLDKEEEDVE
jgi:alpha-aminoadipate carrier protein LysW